MGFAPRPELQIREPGVHLVNKPAGLSIFLFPSSDQKALGSVRTPTVMRFLRPATFGLWLIIFSVQLTAIVTTGAGGNWLVLLLSTALFAGVHIQFWYEESDRGRRVHHAIERMRGRLYEDEATGLANSRHFVFELRRQMTRSVRNGRGFSLLLTDIAGLEPGAENDPKMLQTVARALRPVVQDGDFLAHLQGATFAAIVLDDREATAAAKSDLVFAALASSIPHSLADTLYPVVSFTGYEGELQVRDFLRRSQRDLLANRSRGGSPLHRERGPQNSIAAA